MTYPPILEWSTVTLPCCWLCYSSLYYLQQNQLCS